MSENRARRWTCGPSAVDIEEVTCPRIAVLGTDCAIGKRTTATVLTRALNEYGLKAVMIGTGQTGLIQGARYGIALDAVPSQFCAGELEATIVEAFECETPDVIIIEGQGALSHPAYSTSAFILRGSRPDGVVLQHAPGRTHRCDFEQMAMPSPATEIHLIETFAETKVIGLTINHEYMSDAEVDAAIEQYESELGIPATDALTRSPKRLVDMTLTAFPQLLAASALRSPLTAPRLEIDLGKIHHNASHPCLDVGQAWNHCHRRDESEPRFARNRRHLDPGGRSRPWRLAHREHRSDASRACIRFDDTHSLTDDESGRSRREVCRCELQHRNRRYKEAVRRGAQSRGGCTALC